MSAERPYKLSQNYTHAILASERQAKIDELVQFARMLIHVVGEPPTAGLKDRVRQEALRRFRVSDETAKSYSETVYAILRGNPQ